MSIKNLPQPMYSVPSVEILKEYGEKLVSVLSRNEPWEKRDIVLLVGGSVVVYYGLSRLCSRYFLSLILFFKVNYSIGCTPICFDQRD